MLRCYMNKYVFADIKVERNVVLSKNEKFRVGKKTKYSDFTMTIGKGQFATEFYKITAGEIEFEAEVTRKDYEILKAEVNNLIKANIIIYGDKFVNDIAFAEKQLQKGLKEKFDCKTCSLVSLEGFKTIEGDFLVKSSLKKDSEKEMMHLISEEITINYNNLQLNK